MKCCPKRRYFLLLGILLLLSIMLAACSQEAQEVVVTRIVEQTVLRTRFAVFGSRDAPQVGRRHAALDTVEIRVGCQRGWTPIDSQRNT